MKLKLDECLDARLATLLRQAGHEADTVCGQGMSGAEDSALLRHCVAAGTVFVTLDRAFSNTLLYPPNDTSGIVVLRGPDDLLPTLRLLIETLIEALRSDSPAGRLWIVEIRRVRIHET